MPVKAGRLKHITGWFAAGHEISSAVARLSDGWRYLQPPTENRSDGDRWLKLGQALRRPRCRAAGNMFTVGRCNIP